MNDRLKELIVSCVIGRVKFPSLGGAFYTVQDFFEKGTISLPTVEAIAQRLNKQLKGKDELFGDGEESDQDKTLRLQVDTLVAIRNYRKANKERAEKAAATRKANEEEAATIRRILAEKRINALEKTDEKALEKRLQELEG